MQNSISDSLNTILIFLKKWKFPACNFLNNALSELEITNAFDTVGLTPTRELIELYLWRNGTKIKQGTLLDDVQIIPGFHFLSLEDAISNYLSMKNGKEYSHYWFPVFANGGGDFYAVDLSQSNGETAPIIGFIRGEPKQEVEYKNLTCMLLTFVECFESGIVFLTEEGYLEMDDNKQAKIATKHNPDLKIWQTYPD